MEDIKREFPSQEGLSKRIISRFMMTPRKDIQLLHQWLPEYKRNQNILLVEANGSSLASHPFAVSPSNNIQDCLFGCFSSTTVPSGVTNKKVTEEEKRAQDCFVNSFIEKRSIPDVPNLWYVYRQWYFA